MESILDGIASRYMDLMNRAPDATGLAFWVQQAQIDDQNDQNAGRIAFDPTSVSALVSVSQKTWNAIDAAFLSSNEFQMTDGHAGIGASAFAALLYQDVLHRTADSVGLGYWVAQLNSGGNSIAAQTAAFEGFVNSPEYLAAHAATSVNLTAGQTYSLTSDNNLVITAVAGPPTSVTIVGNGADTVNTLMAPGSTVSVNGNGNHTITADAGNNTITAAGDGDNVITVGSGDNVITVGSGSNFISAANGNGDNSIVFSAANGGSATSYTTIWNTVDSTDQAETLAFHVHTIGGNTVTNVETTIAPSIAAGIAAANLADGYNLFLVKGSENTFLYEYTGDASTSELVVLSGVAIIKDATSGGIINVPLGYLFG